MSSRIRESSIINSALSNVSRSAMPNSAITSSISQMNSSLPSDRSTGLSNVDVCALGGLSSDKKTALVEEIVATSLKDRKLLALRMVGVGYLNIPSSIRHHKLVLSILLYVLFSLNSIALGVMFYGTRSVLNDFCYSPIDPDALLNLQEGQPYTCTPASPVGFVSTSSGRLLLYFFEIGCVFHTLALAIGIFVVLYLSIAGSLVFMAFYLLSYTLILLSMVAEFFFVDIGLAAYFSISQTILGAVMAYLVFEVFVFTLTIGVIIQWVSHLSQ